MPGLYLHGRRIYSVDMMLCYVNIHKPEIKIVKLSSLKKFLSSKAWGNPNNSSYYSPLEVIKNPEKYKKDHKKILKAKLKYPIIMCEGTIIDGYHRLTKAHTLHKKTIKVLTFDKKTLEKFYLGSDIKKVNEMAMFEYIKLFNERFCMTTK